MKERRAVVQKDSQRLNIHRQRGLLGIAQSGLHYRARVIKNMLFERATEKFLLNPKKLFLIDGLGAILSAFLLGFVLIKLERIFGIPQKTLYFFAFLPCLFATYDFYCYLKIKKNIGIFLKGIAFGNLLYCGLSIGLAIYHYQRITYMGWGYITLEVLIVISLVVLELKAANKLSSRQKTL